MDAVLKNSNSPILTPNGVEKRIGVIKSELFSPAFGFPGGGRKNVASMYALKINVLGGTNKKPRP
jgi:hypothetical protein